jgi:hypothetical protein
MDLLGVSSTTTREVIIETRHDEEIRSNCAAKPRVNNPHDLIELGVDHDLQCQDHCRHAER